jgi:hypothetical protein
VADLVRAVSDLEIAFLRKHHDPVWGEKLFKSPCPPVMEMPGPLATTRGPTR